MTVTETKKDNLNMIYLKINGEISTNKMLHSDSITELKLRPIRTLINDFYQTNFFRGYRPPIGRRKSSGRGLTSAEWLEAIS